MDQTRLWEKRKRKKYPMLWQLDGNFQISGKSVQCEKIILFYSHLPTHGDWWMPGHHWLVYKCSFPCHWGGHYQCWGYSGQSHCLQGSTSWSSLSPAPPSPPAGSPTCTWGLELAVVTQLEECLPENIGRLLQTVLDETLQFYRRPRHHMFLLFSFHWHWGHWNANILLKTL